MSILKIDKPFEIRNGHRFIETRTFLLSGCFFHLLLTLIIRDKIVPGHHIFFTSVDVKIELQVNKNKQYEFCITSTDHKLPE
jgi:hypothetical protein